MRYLPRQPLEWPVLRLLSRLSVLPFVLLCAFAAPAPAQSSSDALRDRVEALHASPGTLIAGRRLFNADAVVHFLEARSFTPPWSADAIAEICNAIRHIDADGLTPSEYHLAALEAKTSSEQSAIDQQILVTDAIAALIDHVRYGKVRPSSLDRHWNVDPRAHAPALVAVLAQVAAHPTAETIEKMKPDHFIYRGLRQALARFRQLSASGGWPTIAAGPPLKPGATESRIAAVRRRLAATGELAADPPSTDPTYDEALETAVKKFQDEHRLTADGVIGRLTIDAMNVTAQARADQARVNLDRVRWVVHGLSDSFVLVNLPAFKVYVIRDRKNIWESRTQIGREARQTPSFLSNMRYIVFNPDWTVPPTILAKDVLEGMRKGQNPIARKRLTILDGQGHAVPPDSIDWQTVAPRTFPYTLRQPPGPDNALGRVKFIFPNEHSIFLHDTPSRELFTADQRTFSSGCIRVERPLELAATLLHGRDDWTPETIGRVVEAGKSQTVFLKDPLPVVIVYWTVSVGASGDVHFARDVYGRDAAVLRALATAPVPTVTR
jgi:murein L,D-transpeptidase YcbB/YkuD